MRLSEIIKFMLYIIGEIQMKYVNKCSLYLYNNSQRCANHKGVAQKFTYTSSRLPVFKVWFRTMEFHRPRTKNKMYISSKMIPIYSCHQLKFLMGRWECYWRNVYWTFLVVTWMWFWPLRNLLRLPKNRNFWNYKETCFCREEITLLAVLVCCFRNFVIKFLYIKICLDIMIIFTFCIPMSEHNHSF